MINDIRGHRGNACFRICTPLQAFIHETDANSELQRYTAELQDRAPLQAQSAIQFWLDRESSYRRLSQPVLDLVAYPASQAYVERLFSLCGNLTARKRSRTRMSLYMRVFLKLDRRDVVSVSSSRSRDCLETYPTSRLVSSRLVSEEFSNVSVSSRSRG